MPGIFGFAGKLDPAGTEQLLPRMAAALDPADGYCVDLHQEDGIGIGRVSLGIVNPERQPIWNADQTCCIVMEGELYDSRSLKQSLTQRGYQFVHDNDPELILHLYEEYGDNLANQLNGAFIAAIWDRPARKLVLVNDRLGLYPTYYAVIPGGLVFASGVRAVMAAPYVPRRVDPTAIAEFLTFDHVLQDRSLLQDVRLMPQAMIMTFSDGDVNFRRYYELQYASPYSLRDETDWMDEYNFLLKQAIIRQAADELPAGILLSGGLDSRQLLAYLCREAKTTSFLSFTWGIPGCDDARFADEIAAKTCVQHRFYELKPDWLLVKAEEAVRLTDGMGNLVNLHALATLDQEAELVKVIYKGFLGDAMMGFALRPQFWAMYDDPTRIQAHLQVHSDQGVLNYKFGEYPQLFTEPFQQTLGDSVLQDYKSGMDEAGTPQMADQRVFFDFRHRVPRMTIKGVEVVRSKTFVRLPFADNDLVEFSLRLPPGLRYERRLQRNAFIRDFPELAQIPTTDTGLPMMSCFRDVYLRGLKVVRWHLKKKGLDRLAGRDTRHYKDYNLWFRTVLRQWVEGTLLDKRSLDRGYFNPEFIRKLVSSHMSGENHAGRIGALMALELWHRLYLD